MFPAETWVIETERLHLRRLRPDDRDALARTFGEPVVRRLVGSGTPLSLADVAAMLERIERRFVADGFGQLGVERRADGLLIGRAGLLPLDPAPWQAGSRLEIGPTCEIEIGWTLARDAWGHGYATEAALAIREWARDTLRLQRLVAIIQLRNSRSMRVARKLAMRRERRIVTSFGRPAWLYALELGDDPTGSHRGSVRYVAPAYSSKVRPRIHMPSS